MDGWSQCPQCGLRHRTRADGRCPRCSGGAIAEAPGAADLAMAPGAVAFAAPVVDATPMAGATMGASSADVDPLPVRLGGAGLVLTAVVILYERATVPELFADGVAGNFWTGAILDLGLGGALLLGVRSVLPLVLVRLGLGLLLFTGIHLFQGNYLGAVEQAMLCGGLLLVLAGRPGRGRLVAGVAAVVLGLGIETAALVAVKSGNNVFQELMTAHETEAAPESGVVEGRTAAWTLPLPAEGWKLYTEEAAAKKNPLADRWLTLPARDAHLIVIREELPEGAVIDEAALPPLMEENMRKAHPGARFELWERQSGESWRGIGTQATAEAEGVALRMRFLAIVSSGAVYQVLAIYPERAAEAVEADIEGAIAQLTLP